MMEPKDPISWCATKIREALADYDAKTAGDYLDLLEQWMLKLNK